MGRIEISLEEYNSYNSQILELENKLIEKEKENNNINGLLDKSKEIIDDLVNSSLYERVFQWNTIIKSIDKKFLN